MLVHTEYDAQVFAYFATLLVGAGVCGVYGLFVVIGVIIKLFRSRKALICSFVLAGLMSIPVVWVVISQWEVLPRHWDSDSGGGILLFLLNIILLCTVWVAPIAQYRWLRWKTRELAEAESDAQQDA